MNEYGIDRVLEIMAKQFEDMKQTVSDFMKENTRQHETIGSDLKKVERVYKDAYGNGIKGRFAKQDEMEIEFKELKGSLKTLKWVTGSLFIPAMVSVLKLFV